MKGLFYFYLVSSVLWCQIQQFPLLNTQEFCYQSSTQMDEFGLYETNFTDFNAGLNSYPIVDFVLNGDFKWVNAEVDLIGNDFIKIDQEILNDSVLRLRLFCIDNNDLDSIIVSNIWVHSLGSGVLGDLYVKSENGFLSGVNTRYIVGLNVNNPENISSYVISTPQNHEFCENRDTFLLDDIVINEMYPCALKYYFQQDDKYQIALNLNDSLIQFNTQSNINIETNNAGLIFEQHAFNNLQLILNFTISDFNLFQSSFNNLIISGIQVTNIAPFNQDIVLTYDKSESDLYFWDQYDDTIAVFRQKTNPVVFYSNLSEHNSFCSQFDSEIEVQAFPDGGIFDWSSSDGMVEGIQSESNLVYWQSDSIFWNDSLIANQDGFNYTGVGNEFKPLDPNSKNLLINYSLNNNNCVFDKTLVIKAFGPQIITDQQGVFFNLDSVTENNGIKADTLGVSLLHGWDQNDGIYWLVDSVFFQEGGILKGYFQGNSVGENYFFPMTHFTQNMEDPYAYIQYVVPQDSGKCPAIFPKQIKVIPPDFYYNPELWIQPVSPGSLEELCMGQDSLIFWFRRDTVLQSFYTRDEQDIGLGISNQFITDSTTWEIQQVQNNLNYADWGIYYYDVDSVALQNANGLFELIDFADRSICETHPELNANISNRTDTCDKIVGDSVEYISQKFRALSDWINTPKNKAMKYQLNTSSISDTISHLDFKIYYTQFRVTLDSLRKFGITLDSTQLEQSIRIQFQNKPKALIEDFEHYYCSNQNELIPWSLEGVNQSFFIYDSDSNLISEIIPEINKISDLDTGRLYLKASSSFDNSICTQEFWDTLMVYDVQEDNLIHHDPLCIGNSVEWSTSDTSSKESVNWLWDNQFIDSSNHIFIEEWNAGEHIIALSYNKIFPFKSCEVHLLDTVFVGHNPEAHMKFKGWCSGMNLQLVNFSTTETSMGQFIEHVTWMNGNDLIGNDSIMNLNGTGNIDTIKLLVETSMGCKDSLKQYISQLSYHNVENTQSYFEDFENAGGWETADAFGWAVQNSWNWGEQLGNLSNGSRFWKTSHDSLGSYLPYQQSSIFSPCFNLTNTENPILHFDLAIDTEPEMDGLTLEYAYCTSEDFAQDLIWKKVGSGGNNLNWFNTNYIYSQPGEDNSSFAGWSASEKYTFKHVASAISNIKNGSQDSLLIFRFSFASNDGNPPSKSWEGAGIDNFRIEANSSPILIENFTNVATDLYWVKNALDSLEINTENINYIQYPIQFPQIDPAFENNPEELSARSLNYIFADQSSIFINGMSSVHFHENLSFDSLIQSIQSSFLNLTTKNLQLNWIYKEGFKDSLQVIVNGVEPNDKLRALVYFTTDRIIDRQNLYLGSLEGVNGVAINAERPQYTFDLKEIYHLPDSTPIELYVIIQDFESMVVEAHKVLSNIYPVDIYNNLRIVDNVNLQIYPNPSARTIQIKGINIADIKSVQLLNAQGKQVFHNNPSIETIDIGNLRRGWYYVLIEMNKGKCGAWIYKE